MWETGMNEELKRHSH